jgi:hypothetical protein
MAMRAGGGGLLKPRRLLVYYELTLKSERPRVLGSECGLSRADEAVAPWPGTAPYSDRAMAGLVGLD